MDERAEVEEIGVIEERDRPAMVTTRFMGSSPHGRELHRHASNHSIDVDTGLHADDMNSEHPMTMTMASWYPLLQPPSKCLLVV